MTNMSCDCKGSCIGFAVIASVFIGIVVAILQFTCIITLAPVFSWVVLGIAAVTLAIILGITAFGSCQAMRCVRSVFSALITGILGALLTAFIILAVGFATGVIGAIFVGLMAAFISLVITTVVCLIRCLVRSCDQ